MEEEKKGDEEVRYDSYGKVLKKVEEVVEEEGPRKDSYGKVIKPAEDNKPKKQVVMPGTKEDVKKVYDYANDEEDSKFVKHESFDQWLANEKEKDQVLR